MLGQLLGVRTFSALKYTASRPYNYFSTYETLRGGHDVQVAVIDRYDSREKVVTRFTVKIVHRALLHHLDYLQNVNSMPFHFKRPTPAVQQEALALTVMADSPFLAGLITARMTVEYVFYVIEMPVVINLRSFMNHHCLDEEHARFYTAEIVCATEYLHCNDIVFVNLSLDNIFIENSGHIKILPFGLCNVDIHSEFSIQTFSFLPRSHQNLIKTSHDRPRDWWNIGVCLFWMLTGHSPFYDENARYPPEKDVSFSDLSQLPRPAVDCVQALLQLKPEQRLGMPACPAGPIRAHAFFASVNWEALSQKQVTPPSEMNLEASEYRVRFSRRYLESEVNEVLSWVCEHGE